MKTTLATATLAGALLCAALPSFADRPSRSERLIDEARVELAALEFVADDVRDRELRHRLIARIDRVDALLSEAEGTMDSRGGLTFGEARTIVSSESFDSGKVDAIERVARQGRFTTAEARSLAALCSFDSAKADALIALYPAVTDPWRFELALDVLDFSSTRDRVRRAILP